MGQNEFSERSIKGVAVDSSTSRENKVRRGSIPFVGVIRKINELKFLHGVASSNHFATRPQDILYGTLRVWSLENSRCHRVVVVAQELTTL